MKKIKWMISIIKSGYFLKDKLALGLYFMAWPLRRTFFKNMKLISNVLVKNQDGIFYCGNNFSAVGCVHISYEKELRNIFRNVKKGIFIDVGANIGKYTIMVGKKIKGKVIAIEPEEKNFEILKKNIELNNLKNIIPVRSACSSKSKKRKFFLDRQGIGTHSFYKIKIGKTDKIIYIKTERLDNLISKNLEKKEIKEISLIKIDVEGAEADVLKGTKKTLKKYHPKILVEVWNNKSLEKVRKILLPLGYKEKKLNKENYLFNKEE